MWPCHVYAIQSLLTTIYNIQIALIYLKTTRYCNLTFDQIIFFFFQNIDYTHRQGLLKVVIFVELWLLEERFLKTSAEWYLNSFDKPLTRIFQKGGLCILDVTQDQNLDFSSHSSTEILIWMHRPPFWKILVKGLSKEFKYHSADVFIHY
jgi:hypothetical protein